MIKMGGRRDGEGFSVRVSRKDVVTAAVPLQEHWLPLSNLDLLLPPVDVAVFFCYNTSKSTSGSGPSGAEEKEVRKRSYGSMVGLLKKAMSECLVSFYALAGEVVANSAGEPELLCNNRGVDFFEAFADIELPQLNLYNPDDTIEAKLVPKKNSGVLAVQATELKCGGLVVSCTFDHRIADAYSANMFLVSWAEIAQSKPISTLPSFRRSILNPRHPLSINPSLNHMYIPLNLLPPPNKHPAGASHDSLISRIYNVPSHQLVQLQSLANNINDNVRRRSKLECFSAFLWKLVAKCSYVNKSCKMGVVVNGRTMLSDGLMTSYFGNVLSIPFGSIKVEELIEMPLSLVVDKVHEVLEEAMTKEHFLGLIDWVEAHRPVGALAKVYACGREDGPAFVVSSGQRFPVSKVDFGWGKPIFGSYHFPWGGDAGYVMPMPSPSGNGDWVVYMHLFKSQLEFIETEAPHLFIPFTFDCLIYN